MAITSAKAPQSNGCFEICAALPGASPWPPPPVTKKNYQPEAGTLLWSKFNGDRRLAGPQVEDMMCNLGDLLDLMAMGDEDVFSAAVASAMAARLEANRPKKKPLDPKPKKL